jgi:hypothetical protein
MGRTDNINKRTDDINKRAEDMFFDKFKVAFSMI